METKFQRKGALSKARAGINALGGFGPPGVNVTILLFEGL
jgi:hypothetical protein